MNQKSYKEIYQMFHIMTTFSISKMFVYKHTETTKHFKKSATFFFKKKKIFIKLFYVSILVTLRTFIFCVSDSNMYIMSDYLRKTESILVFL